MRACSRLKNSTGLTMLELLASLALLTLILLPLSNAWSSGLRLFNTQMAYSQAHQDTQTILDIISHKIRRAKKLEIVGNPKEAGSFMLRLTTVDNVEESYYKSKQGTDIWVIRGNGHPEQVLSDLQQTDIFDFTFFKANGQPYNPKKIYTLGSGEYVEIKISLSPRNLQGGMPYEARTIVCPRN